MIVIRVATFEDLDGIMHVEKEMFASVEEGGAGMASPETMRHRIGLLNAESPGWFLIAENEGDVIGYVITQPTHLAATDCYSWEIATDGGQLTNTFNPDGRNLYGVSVGVLSVAPQGTADLLMHQILLQRLNTGKKDFMFCARMPGFQSAHEATGISAEEYWQETRADGSPLDDRLHRFFEMFGESPVALLSDGWSPDARSGGHGVLFRLQNPECNLRASARCILKAGISLNKAKKEVLV